MTATCYTDREIVDMMQTAIDNHGRPLIAMWRPTLSWWRDIFKTNGFPTKKIRKNREGARSKPIIVVELTDGQVEQLKIQAVLMHRAMNEWMQIWSRFLKNNLIQPCVQHDVEFWNLWVSHGQKFIEDHDSETNPEHWIVTGQEGQASGNAWLSHID